MQHVAGFDPAWSGPVSTATGRVTALILAGDRQRPDPVARAAGTDCKVMAPVAGQPMLERVTHALTDSGRIKRTLLCGPPHSMLDASPSITQGLESGRLDWIDEYASPAASTLAGIDALTHPWPLLVTTGDHALLRPSMITAFVQTALSQPWDIAVGVVPQRLVTACYPRAAPTATRLGDGAITGCNLFALSSERSRQLVAYWRELERGRKNPLRIITGAIGLPSVLTYTLGRLTLDTALARLSARAGLTVGAVVLPHAAAGLDVDSVGDWELASRIAQSAPKPMDESIGGCQR